MAITNGTWRATICLTFALVIWGCSRSAPPDAASAPPPPVSYDGRYEGTVQVVNTTRGLGSSNCDAEPRISFDVKNNAFVYVQRHPQAAGTAPGLTESKTTVTYNAKIASNGTITGDSGGGMGGSITGHVAGAHMSGEIHGLLCGYTFTAERT